MRHPLSPKEIAFYPLHLIEYIFTNSRAALDFIYFFPVNLTIQTITERNVS